MHRRGSRGFTIVELLVVVSIIALLIGILLPAIGKARDTARVTISTTNLRQLGQAHATYASEWGDRQLTLVRDDISRYGTSAANAVDQFNSITGSLHPGLILGWGTTLDGPSGLIGYWMEAVESQELFELLDRTVPRELEMSTDHLGQLRPRPCRQPRGARGFRRDQASCRQ